MRWLICMVWVAGCGKAVGDGDGIVDDQEVPRVGWSAVFDGRHHDLAGEALIIDEHTLELRDFTYDGNGLNARLFLLADGEAFHRDFELTDNLVGDPFDGETFQVDIPEAATFEHWNLITLWCIPAAVSFGEGVFEPPAR